MSAGEFEDFVRRGQAAQAAVDQQLELERLRAIEAAAREFRAFNPHPERLPLTNYGPLFDLLDGKGGGR